MNPLYDQRSKAGYERMQERMQMTKGRDVKELSSQVENKRRMEKEERLEREEEHRKMLSEHAADLRNRVKTAGAAGRDEKKLNTETEKRRQLMVERSQQAKASMQASMAAEAQEAKRRIQQAGSAPKSNFALSREVEMRRETEESLRLQKNKDIAERMMREGVTYKRRLKKLAEKGGRDSKEMSDVAKEHLQGVNDWRLQLKMEEAERLAKENADYKKRIKAIKEAPSGDDRAKEDAAATFVRKLISAKKHELEKANLDRRNDAIRKGTAVRPVGDPRSRAIKEAEQETAWMRKQAEEQWIQSNKGFVSAIAMVPTSKKHALGMSGAAGKDAKGLDPHIEMARAEAEERRLRLKALEAERLEKQNQEYLQRLAQAKAKDSKSLSKEVLEQRREIERSRNERNKIKAFYLDRDNAAARGRLENMTMYRDGVNPLAALRTSPKDELKRARSTVPPDVMDFDDDNDAIGRTWSDVSDMNHLRPHTSMA